MNEKRILVTRSSMPSLEEFVEEIAPIWDSAWLTNMGEKHTALESELKKYLSVEDLQLFTNGHMALELCLQAFDLEGEVITTPFTFASTTHAIVRNGLTPVFCDIDPVNYTIDVTKLESLITDKTCAIVPVHVYGNLCNVEEIERIAKKHNLKVIYDAAHTFGVEKDGVGVGNFGDASMFSFHATKVYNTIEGGAVTFKKGDLHSRLYNLKNFGILDESHVDEVGGNAKMNEFQAAMGLCNLRHVDGEIAKRKKAVEQYRKRLAGISGVKLVPEYKGVKSNYAYFPIVFDESEFGATRDEVCNALAKHNIFARKYFYPITNSFDCYKDKYDANDTPVALWTSLRIITAPLFADLTVEDVDKICDIILSCKK